MKIPTFQEAFQSKLKGNETPLDNFIIHNEPAGYSDEMHFRKTLQEVVNYICDCKKEQAENPDSNI